ncbi:NUDIX domain-containing protein [bacterium]|nr:NUDIX domain-containing protein [bacterium]
MQEQRIRNRVAVILIDDGKILLVKHEKNGREYWLLPGGGVDYGETLEQAAIRELKEESNLNVRIGDLLFISESIPDDKHRHVINYYFEGKVISGDMQVGEDTVLRDVQWNDISRLPHMTIYPNTVREILRWYESNSIEKRSLGNRWE